VRSTSTRRPGSRTSCSPARSPAWAICPAAAREYRAAADTLGRRATDAAAPELGGRRPAELAALCAELAGRVTA
jgi:hypothetical protein